VVVPLGIEHLLQALALQQLLYGVAWWLAGRLRPEAHRASVHWTAFSAVSALAVALVIERPFLPAWAGVSLALWLLLASFVLLRRGSEYFFGLHPADREHLATLGLMAAVLLWVGPGLEASTVRAPAFTLLTALVAVRGVRRIHQPMHAEFGPGLAWGTHVPALCVAGLLLARTVWVLGQPADQVQLDRLLFMGDGVVYALQIAAATVHFAYGGMLATRLSRGLLHLSRHDGMTGLLNRMAGTQQLDVEWQRFVRSGQSFAVLMVDADHFKRINDEHGHLAGDEVLVQLASLLQRTSRPMDAAARMGGEEFMLVMPGADAAGARAAAERLRRAVQASFATRLAEAQRLTVSVGWTLAGEADTNGQAVLARADRALYLAKAAGRNRVCSLLPPSPEPGQRAAA
jgi:diguanylate cyclase (GGDEF)-like protein